MLTKNQAKRISASLSLVDKETSLLFKAIGMPGKSLKKIKANAIEAKKISQIASDMIVNSMKNKNDIVVASSYPAIGNLHQKAVSMAARAELIIKAAEAEMEESDEFKDLPEEELGEELEDTVEAEEDEIDELDDEEEVVEAEEDELDELDEGELDDEIEAEETVEELEEDEIDELDDEEPVVESKKVQKLRRASVTRTKGSVSASKNSMSIRNPKFWAFV